MAAKIGLQHFRFSIYIDADGTVTLTDLPPELREVVVALNPSYQWGKTCPVSPPIEALPLRQPRACSGQSPENGAAQGDDG